MGNQQGSLLLGIPVRKEVVVILKCEICNTTQNIKTKTKNNKFNMILCQRHYKQMYRHGEVFERTIYDANEIIENENFAEMFLYNKKGDVICKTFIDIDDIEKIKKYKWTFTGTYIKNELNNIYLHRYILNYKGEEDVDHINRNKLDNRKSNLRIITHEKNSQNKSMQRNNNTNFIGVIYDTARKKWRAEIRCQSKDIYLGRFDEIEDAKIARLNAEFKYFGQEVAPQRHLFKYYGIPS